MNKYITVLPFVLGVSLTYAQSSSSILVGQDAENNINTLFSQNVNGVVRTHDGRYQGIKGSPFFLDKWCKASISMADHKVYDGINLNYNVYENTLYFLDTKGIERVLHLNNVSRFTLYDSVGFKEYNFVRFEPNNLIDEKLSDRYFLLLYEGEKLKFGMLPEKQILKADFKGGYSAGKPYDEFITGKTYIISTKDYPISKVKLNKRQLLEIMADKKTEIELYLRNNKIDASTESGWINALTHYSTLQ